MIKMSKEELVGKLNLIYVGNKDALDEMIGYYDGLKMVIEQLKEDNKKQKTIIRQVVKEIERFSYCKQTDTYDSLGGSFIRNMHVILKGDENE